MTIVYFLLLLLLQILAVLANTEKVIFIGPSSLKIPTEHPTLEDLQLNTLSPQHWSLRTLVQAEFPTNSSKYGQSSWYLLHRLQEGQRYEVRICWPATQPTSFRLDTYDLPTVFATPELITSLAQYSDSRQPEVGSVEAIQAQSLKQAAQVEHTYDDDASSTLFLHILAAADYYTMNQTLMQYVEPVFVDIILDPFIFNIFPRSLIPTGAYIALLAIGSWYLSKYISEWVLKIAKEPSITKKDA